MTGPILHAVVEDERVGYLVQAMRERLERDAQHRAEGAEQRIREAYRRGVLDGFQQGALAADAAAIARTPPITDGKCWPTYECLRCGYRQGPFPDDETAKVMLAVVAAHEGWCPARAAGVSGGASRAGEGSNVNQGE